jgi:alkanesulfonate monooxygenase SsuD/methylene tetrahydromethanopterin reductase-like flavin-dependent oxidoreductase (luciferase family)
LPHPNGSLTEGKHPPFSIFIKAYTELEFGVSPSPFIWWKGLKEFDLWIAEAENCEYDGIYMPDHYDLPVPEFPSNKLAETWTTLAYVAAKTKNMRIGTVASPIPRYIPSQLAKIIAHVDILSEGRVTAGLGAGWNREEFINYSPHGYYDEAKVRMERFLEGLQIMIKLWTEDKVTFKGKYYRLENATLLPKPVQKPHPRIWSGGFGSHMLKISAKYFNGWFVHREAWAPEKGGYGAPTPEEYGERVKTIKKYLQDYGRSVNEFTFALLGWMPEKERMKDETKIIEKYAEHGCQYYIVEIPLNQPLSDGKYVELLRSFAKEIVSSFR